VSLRRFKHNFNVFFTRYVLLGIAPCSIMPRLLMNRPQSTSVDVAFDRLNVAVTQGTYLTLSAGYIKSINILHGFLEN
jgi:hypothetical protein